MKETKKKLLSLLMAFSMLVAMPVSALAVTKPALIPVLEGEGTEASPFLIGTADELLCYFDYEESLNGSDKEDPVVTYAELTADLVFDGEYDNYNSFNSFYGVLDGKGHTISGIDSIYTPFVSRNCGTLKNLIFADCTFRDTEEVTGLVRYNDGLIEYCVMTPTVVLELYEDDMPPAPGYYRPPLHGVIAGDNYGTIRCCVSLATSELEVSGICPNSFEGGEVYECVTSWGSIESDKTVVFVEDEEGYPLGFEYAVNENPVAENCAALGSRTYSGLEAPVSEEEMFSADFAARMTADTGVEWVVSDYGVVPASVSDLLKEENWQVDEVNPTEYYSLFSFDPEAVTELKVGDGSCFSWYDLSGTAAAKEIISLLNDFQYSRMSEKLWAGWSYGVSFTIGDERYQVIFNDGVNGFVMHGSAAYFCTNSEALACLVDICDGYFRWAEEGLSDVPFNTWYSEAVYNCAVKNIINGYSDGTFRPDAQLTRAEAVKMIVEAFDVEATDNHPMTLSDAEGHWAYNYIDRAVAAGVAGGYPDGTFRPDAPITRAELLKMLLGAAQLGIPEGEEGLAVENFVDCRGHWAADAVEIAIRHGLVSGYEDGTFKPDNNVTRAEAAKLIYSVLSLSE